MAKLDPLSLTLVFPMLHSIEDFLGASKLEEGFPLYVPLRDGVDIGSTGLLADSKSMSK